MEVFGLTSTWNYVSLSTEKYLRASTEYPLLFGIMQRLCAWEVLLSYETLILDKGWKMGDTLTPSLQKILTY